MKVKLISIAISTLLSTSAMAWGDREQGILTGIAGLWLFQKLNQPPVVVQPPQQVPVQPPSYVIIPNCRQVLAIELDRFGNEYRRPVTICNQ